MFGGAVVGESAVQFESQIGPQVTHTFEVINVHNITGAAIARPLGLEIGTVPSYGAIAMG